MSSSFFYIAASAAAILPFGLTGVAGAIDGPRISGPIVHENLAIYFVHGPSVAGPVPLTLQEALAKGTVGLHETGQVNELAIENFGDEEVFIQSGDIVKGGKQDRVLTVSIVLPAKSGRVPIASFCVEQGRWSARGREDVHRFASSPAAMPSREAKLAMRAPARKAAAGQADAIAARQREVWNNVARIQGQLGAAVGQPVASATSQTSLQLSLENQRLQDAQSAYLKTLRAAGEKDADVIGYVFAVNGAINSADLYPSNGLFRKMWLKLISASVTEAIGAREKAAGAPPSNEAVLAFLKGAESGPVAETNRAANVRFETREGPGALYVATRRTDGAFVHRNYLAK